MEVHLERVALVVVEALLNGDAGLDERGVLDSDSLLLYLTHQQALEVDLVLVESNEGVLAHSTHLQDSGLLLVSLGETANHSSDDDLGLSAVESD